VTDTPAAIPLPDELRAIDARHVWHPHSQHQGAAPLVPIARAVGACLYDHLGGKILDAISSWGTTLHGHAHPVIASAIADAARVLEQTVFSGLTHEPAIRLAEQLTTILPSGLTRVFYTESGSGAVETALKMALQYWVNRGEPRRLFVGLEHAYHGDSFGAMAVSGRSARTTPFAEHLFKVVRLPDPSVDDGEAAAARLRDLLERRASNVAAVIVEPMLLGAGGMRFWPGKTLRAIRQLTEEHGVLLIADESLTGFGRTGPLFACGDADVVPDIICLGKSLTGGFLPLGAAVTREEIFAAFLGDDRSHAFLHGHAYAANPIACAAARTSITLLDDDSAAKRTGIEETHRGQIAALAVHPLVRSPRVLGTLAAFEIGAPADPLDPRGRELAELALAQGVLLRPLGNTVYVLPPYCMSPHDLTDVYSVIGLFLEARC
jgi:adenosylmethionine-8-amino-7-oxononanoate aminotransferase